MSQHVSGQRTQVLGGLTRLSPPDNDSSGSLERARQHVRRRQRDSSNPGQAGRSKYWCFTLNNYTEQELSGLMSFGETIEVCPEGEERFMSYLVFGKETGEEGTPHLQGYVEFKTRMYFNSVKSIMGPRMHLAMRFSTAADAADYCKKDGQFFEYGTISRPRNGHRTDLDDLRTAIADGASLRTLVDDFFSSFVRYQRGITAARFIYAPMRDFVPSVIVYWGSTNTGKTSSVFDNLANPADLYMHTGTQWFDGYDGHPIALFDDFDGSEFKITYLLKLLDRYPFRVPVKGSYVSWYPREIYFTSNLNPNLWYLSANSEHIAALNRRFTNVVHFPNPQ